MITRYIFQKSNYYLQEAEHTWYFANLILTFFPEKYVG